MLSKYDQRSSLRKIVQRTAETHPAPTPQPTACRLWQGADDGSGYGLRYVGGRKTKVHRWVVEVAGEDQFGKPWDPNLDVMHLCDNPLCFRFDHLRLGTRAENNHDAIAKGRHAHGERNGSAKLTWDDVTVIRRRLADGETRRAIADDFSVSSSIVSRIALGKLWSRPPDCEQVTPC